MPKAAKATLLTGFLLLAASACGSDAGSGTDGQHPPPRAQPDHTQVSFEPVEITNQVEPEEDAIYTRLLHYRLRELGTIDTVETPDGPLRPARGEKFYAASFKVDVDESFLKELRKKWDGSSVPPYAQDITVRGNRFDILDEEAIEQLLKNGELEHDSFTIVASSWSSRGAPEFAIDESVEGEIDMGVQALALDEARSVGDYLAVEPAFVELDDTYRFGEEEEKPEQYGERQVFHEIEFLSAESSTESLDTEKLDGSDLRSPTSAVTIRARWRYGFDTSDGMLGGYPYDSIIKLVDSDGEEYGNIAGAGDTVSATGNLVEVRSDNPSKAVEFIFEVPRDERSFRVVYEPKVVLDEFLQQFDLEHIALGSHEFTIDLSK